MQVQNDSWHISVCSLNLEVHFNKQLNDKVYNTFKESLGSINVDSMKEVLPKVSIYNDAIAKFVEEINSRYGMVLTFTHLEYSEVGYWVETFQVAKGNNDRLELA